MSSQGNGASLVLPSRETFCSPQPTWLSRETQLLPLQSENDLDLPKGGGWIRQEKHPWVEQDIFYQSYLFFFFACPLVENCGLENPAAKNFCDEFFMALQK